MARGLASKARRRERQQALFIPPGPRHAARWALEVLTLDLHGFENLWRSSHLPLIDGDDTGAGDPEKTIVGIIGQERCGKSTCSVILGQEQPDSGTFHHFR